MGALLCWRQNANANNVETNEYIQPEPSAKKTYSWDNKRKENLENFKINDVHNGIKVKFPSEINGEHFVIQNCSKSQICVLDFIGSLTIDDCENCQFIMGPVKSSVFIRDCKNCEILVACQQFRTRDCDHLTAFLCCATLPVIENTSKFKIGPYQLTFKGLEDQFKRSGLSIFNCNWTDIHDFTPLDHGLLNYHYLNESSRPFSIIKLRDDQIDKSTNADGDNDTTNIHEKLQNLEILDNPESSVVPYTYSSKRKDLLSSVDTIYSLVIIFDDSKLARDLINYLAQKLPDTYLTKTNELKLSPTIIEELFKSGSNPYQKASEAPIIYLEYMGKSTTNMTVQEYIQQNNISTTSIYVASDSQRAKIEIELISREFRVNLDIS